MSEHFHFISAQANLKQVLSLAKDFINKSSMLPVLQFVLVSGHAGDDFVTLTATNLESVLRVRVASEVVCSGSFCPPYTVLRDLMNTLPADEHVEFRVKDDLLVEIVCGGVSQEANLRLYDPSEYPKIPDVPTDGDGIIVGNLSGGTLQRIVDEVAPLAASDMTRPSLTGVSLRFTDMQLEAAATDGFRLARLIVSTTLSLNTDLIVPAISFAPLGKLIGLISKANDVDAVRTSVTMVIETSTDRLFWQCDGGYIAVNLINGTYPDYSPIIPQSASTTVTVDPKAAYDRAQSAAVITSEGDTSCITIQTAHKDGGEVFRLRAKSDSVGDSDGGMAAIVDGPDLEMAVSAAYLTKSLRIFKGRSDDVVFKMTNNTEPLMLARRNDQALIHLIMPMHYSK